MMLFYDYLARMGCAFVMGTLIGIERQYRQRNAGLRTNILVSVGAAAFTVLSCDMTIGNGDPSRVAAQIVSGIGFIGGGLILKDGFNVRGLNTAATIWCSAACGTLSGVGLYAEAAVLVACVLITHCLFRPLCTWIEKKESGLFQYTVHVECEQNLSNKIQQIIMNVLSFDRNVKLKCFIPQNKWQKSNCLLRYGNARRTQGFIGPACIPFTFARWGIQCRMGKEELTTRGFLTSK